LPHRQNPCRTVDAYQIVLQSFDLCGFAMGQTPTFRAEIAMSALAPKTEIDFDSRYVAFGPMGDRDTPQN